MKIGVLMDPIGSIETAKDTSFAMLLTAQKRGHSVYYLEERHVWVQDNQTWGYLRPITVQDGLPWFDLEIGLTRPLSCLDVLLVRKDPPFDAGFLHLTQLLQLSQDQGLWIVNRLEGLRFANEKLAVTHFPECIPKTLITTQKEALENFVQSEGQAVLKPVDQMGGRSVFVVTATDINRRSLFETMTQDEKKWVMAQTFIPDVMAGDKRIFLINGEPFPEVLLRVPAPGDFRGNLRAGASFQVRSLSEKDKWICDKVGPWAREKGLWFVGLDVIGEYLTEINVTSPTGAREILNYSGKDVVDVFFMFLEENADRFQKRP